MYSGFFSKSEEFSSVDASSMKTLIVSCYRTWKLRYLCMLARTRVQMGDLTWCKLFNGPQVVPNNWSDTDFLVAPSTEDSSCIYE